MQFCVKQTDIDWNARYEWDIASGQIIKRMLVSFYHDSVFSPVYSSVCLLSESSSLYRKWSSEWFNEKNLTFFNFKLISFFLRMFLINSVSSQLLEHKIFHAYRYFYMIYRPHFLMFHRIIAFWQIILVNHRQTLL